MSVSRVPLHSLFDETLAVIEMACEGDPRFSEALQKIKRRASLGDRQRHFKGGVPTHSNLLDTAIARIVDAPFGRLKAALVLARDHLHWKVDDGGFYPKGADVGDGYRSGNMHTLLIGPQNSIVTADDLLLGIFLLAPNTLYRDHKHLAPEIYVPMTGPSGWRFERGDWVDYDAGHAIYNAPNVTHATRVYDTPFLSLFAWTRDVDAPCQVVHADDWPETERNLNGR